MRGPFRFRRGTAIGLAFQREPEPQRQSTESSVNPQQLSEKGAGFPGRASRLPSLQAAFKSIFF